MKVARIAVLGIALAAAGAAAFFAKSKPPAPVQIIQAAPTIETDDVLVAAKDVPMGTLIGDADIAWQAWPRASTSSGMMLKSAAPDAFAEAKGSVTRGSFVQGEPMRKEKLVKGPNSGFMSAILPSGLRAVSIRIDERGESSAGGFILPNDHVDLVRTYKDDAASKAAASDVFSAQTVLTNIRVLAIGQNIQEKNGERVVNGTNATLELTPAQVELVILAQRMGPLSLALRAMVDANQVTPPSVAAAAPPRESSGLTVVRYGVAVSTGKK